MCKKTAHRKSIAQYFPGPWKTNTFVFKGDRMMRESSSVIGTIGALLDL